MTKQPKSSYQKTIKSYNYFTEFSCRILEMSREENGSQRDLILQKKPTEQVKEDSGQKSP